MPDANPSIFSAIRASSDAPGWHDLQSAWEAYSAERARGASPFVAAVAIAARADRLGHAFAVGYPAALERLVPGVAVPSALCVTEDGGNSPKDVLTTLEREAAGYRIDGKKSFVSFGSLAKELIVAARSGVRPEGRPELAVIRLPLGRAGVTVDELPPTHFVPEVPHARLRLESVEIHEEERLPGDGYLHYVKPFRTIEDVHVIGAALGYALGLTTRVGGSPDLVSQLAADLAALSSLQDAKPLDPAVHVALHGCFTRLTDAFSGATFSRVLELAPAEERARWQRDEVLLSVAQRARAARFDSAKRSLGLDT